MKIIDLIKDVLAFKLTPSLFLVGTSEFCKTDRYNYYILKSGGGCCIKSLQDYLIIQAGEFTQMIILTQKGSEYKTIDEGFNLYSSTYLNNKLFIRNRKTKSYWTINKNLQFEESSLNFRYSSHIFDVFYYVLGVNIQRVYPNISWQTDISIFGKYFNLQGDPIPNEIDGELMGFDNLLLVPLRGGQLLALDVGTGEKVWMQDYEGRSGFYTLSGDKIYKHDGLSLMEIDTRTGITIRKLVFAESSTIELQKFYALNYLWAYDDIVILFGFNNDIVMLERHGFQLLEYIQLPTAIPASKENIIWHNNKLYVLDLTNTLHIFEKE